MFQTLNYEKTDIDTATRKILDDQSVANISNLTVGEFSITSDSSVDDIVNQNLVRLKIAKWAESESGKYVLKKQLCPITLHYSYCYMTLEIKYIITAKLYEQDAIYYLLKYK